MAKRKGNKIAGFRNNYEFIDNLILTDATKDIFDNGITLWHNLSTFLDYSQNNR